LGGIGGQIRMQPPCNNNFKIPYHLCNQLSLSGFMDREEDTSISKKDILFTHSYFYKFDSKQWERKMPFPPLGTICAASHLRENSYSVALFDTALKTDPDEIKDYLEKHSPRYLVVYDDGFNYLTKMCLTNMREAAFKMIQYAKEANCTVIVNSSDSTDHFEKFLDKGADYVIKGEGENALLELINTLENNGSIASVSSITYKKNKELINQAIRPVLKELDSLPLPAWDLIDIKPYKKEWQEGDKPFTLNIATTRGCPFKCNWCAKPIYGNRYNSHSPEYIVKLIKMLQEKFEVKRFWMCDDIFGLKPNWVQEFNALIKKENLFFKYYIQSRADLLLVEDTIDALAESGLEEAWIGAESGSQKILDAMDKGTTIKQIEDATQLLKMKKIRVGFFIQYGYLGENQKDVKKTIKMIKTLLPDDLGISVSYPLPGTPFFEKVKSELGSKENWEDSDELAMLFNGTYYSKYYKKLHRYTHKEYRVSKGFQSLRNLFTFANKSRLMQLKSIASLLYYIPLTWLDKMTLSRLQKRNG